MFFDTEKKESLLSFALQRNAIPVKSLDKTMREFLETPCFYMEQSSEDGHSYFPTLPVLQLLVVASDKSSQSRGPLEKASADSLWWNGRRIHVFNAL